MPKRVLIGRVTSDKMDKTVTVLVNRRVMHPLYKKFIRLSKKYAAHDEHNVCQVGDNVRIVECPPISKRKTWTVVSRNGDVLGDVSAAALAAAASSIAHDERAGLPVTVPEEAAEVLATQGVEVSPEHQTHES